ncbi:MAG: GatB/YqeY domain-containing protein [Candidatus Liptonbacteria bacterium]|nr:GatB/YqeY domain-containing protein [Candidatus Liptonbacteria bacterium]
MSLKEKIVADVRNAMKAGDAVRVGILRMLVAAIKNQEIEMRAKGSEELSEEDTMRVLDREAKKRREAAELYVKGGRKDLADREKTEAELIAQYLPSQASDGEITEVVWRLHAGGAKDFGSLMKGAMQELRGKADGARVGAIVKEALGE